MIKHGDYEIEFVVHVSNYDHREGGIRGGITMGLPDQIENAWTRKQHISYFLMGVFLIIGMNLLRNTIAGTIRLPWADIRRAFSVR